MLKNGLENYILLVVTKQKDFFMIKRYIEDYLSVNLSDYPNINIDLPISQILLIIMGVLVVSFFVINWHRGYMTLAVKQLIRHEALNEEGAKTLAELGLDKSFSVKRALSGNTRLSKIVERKDAPKYTYEEYIKLSKEQREALLPDFEKDKFYIPKGNMDEAHNVYENYSASMPKTIALSVLLVLIFVGLTLAMPTALSLINEWLG